MEKKSYRKKSYRNQVPENSPKKPPKLYQKPSKTPPKILQTSPPKSPPNRPKLYLKKVDPKNLAKNPTFFFHIIL